jgi:hypothetical protein
VDVELVCIFSSDAVMLSGSERGSVKCRSLNLHCSFENLHKKIKHELNKTSTRRNPKSYLSSPSSGRLLPTNATPSLQPQPRWKNHSLNSQDTFHQLIVIPRPSSSSQNIVHPHPGAFCPLLPIPLLPRLQFPNLLSIIPTFDTHKPPRLIRLTPLL